MRTWRLWAIVLGYGALYGLMGGLLALQDARRAIVWAVAMLAVHAAIVALLWLRWHRGRTNER